MGLIELLLPRSGFYCAAKLAPSGGFIHRFFENTTDLTTYLHAEDSRGATMYLAQASFKTTESRRGVNAQALRSFFIDIDCGAEKFAKEPQKSYPTQEAGARALLAFCEASGLPQPYLVSSGNGLYAHWCLTDDIPAEKWKTLAVLFKNILTAYGFKQDPSRTADAASVLRPVGTMNRKGGVEKAVKQLNMPSEPIENARFIALLDAAARARQVETQVFATPTTFRGVDDEFTAGLEGPTSSLVKIASRCEQIKRIEASRGDVSEPVWYNFIGLARFTEEADELIHEWSQGHGDYNPLLTEAKIRHHAESGVGPTTCAKFAADDPTICVACPHANKIKSPIVLGRPDPISVATKEEEDDLPFGFLRTKDGLFFKGPEDTEVIRFYPYDLHPTKIAYDYSLRCETLTLRHKLPISEAYQEFSVRSALVHSPKDLLMALADNHVQVSGKEARGLMTHYIDSYMSKLRAQRNLACLYTQMGWKELEGGMAFVLGDSIITAEGAQSAGFAQNIPAVAKAFCSQGDLTAWANATAYLGLPGMEGFAFSFLAGAFGAPLLRFTGYSGAMVAMVGATGIGKTLTGEWVLSAYGDPERLRLQKKDTQNMIFNRLGLYGSLPVYMDEISNIEGKDISDFLYGVTQGREKGRLHRSGQERAILNEWNTITIASSNHSLIDKLSNLKSDASAEINRILEIRVAAAAGFGREQATACRRAFIENFGTAGPVYVDYLVKNQERHQLNLDRITRELDAATNAKGDERFWSAVAACAIYGGLIAQKLGLIRFQVAPLIKWVEKHILSMQKDKNDLAISQVDLLGQMLDDLYSGAIICSHNNGAYCEPIKTPSGAVTYRITPDQNSLYIPRSVVKRYMEKHYGSYSALRDELYRVGAMMKDDVRKVLGAGTYLGGTQQPCWHIDLGCAALGRVNCSVVRSLAERRERAA